MAECIKRQKPSICCLQETHLRTKDTYRLKVKGWEKIFYANRFDRKAGVATLISETRNVKTKDIKKDKEGPSLMVKGSIQERMLLSSTYMPQIHPDTYNKY